MSASVSIRHNAFEDAWPTVLSADLRLRNDQLERVRVLGLVDRVVQDANGLEQVSGDLNLAGEICWIGQNPASLGLELHAFAFVVAVLHCRLDTNGLVAVVLDLVNGSVEHVCTAVDGAQASEALRQLSQTVQRVDVWRLAVTRHRVDIQSDALNGLLGHTRCSNVVVSRIKSHAVTDKVPGGSLKTKFIVYFFHRGLRHVYSC